MRIAILGAGEMGAAHAAAYASLGKSEGVEIAGIVSRTPARAQRLARRVKAPGFTDPARVLREESIDAIDIVVPSGLHRRYAVAALEEGKHVFCETPMALTLEDADAMIAAARRNRRILMVAQVMRFVLPYIRARDEVASGSLGTPRVVVARRLSQPYWSRKRPRPFRAYGVPLVELSIHDFDVANWLLGHPISVTAFGRAGATGEVEHAFVSIAHRGGTALVEGSAMMPPGFPFTTALRIQCDAGALDLMAQFLGGPPKEEFIRYKEGSPPQKIRVGGRDPYVLECRHFVRSVLGKVDPDVLSPMAEREAFRVALAAKESIRTGARVRL